MQHVLIAYSEKESIKMKKKKTANRCAESRMMGEALIGITWHKIEVYGMCQLGRWMHCTELDLEGCNEIFGGLQ